MKHRIEKVPPFLKYNRLNHRGGKKETQHIFEVPGMHHGSITPVSSPTPEQQSSILGTLGVSIGHPGTRSQ